MDPKERLACKQAAGNEKSDSIIISSSSESENDLIKEAEAISELEEDDDDRDFIDDDEQSCDDGLYSDAVSEFLKLLDTITVNPKNGMGSSVGRWCPMTGHSQYKWWHQRQRKETERKVSQWQRIKNLESESEDSEDDNNDTEMGNRHPPPPHVAIIENGFGSVKELTEHSQYKRRHQWWRKKTEKKVSQWQRIKNLESDSQESEDSNDDTEIGHRQPPLHVAITENDFGSVKELIKEDSDCVYELGYQKRTALHLAALKGRVDLVKLLLNHGADCTALDCYHLPAIAYAADGHPDCLRLLLDHANIKSICKRMRCNPQGMNLVHFAIGENREVLECENRAKCLELLFSQDKMTCSKLLEERDARAFSPLVAAIYAGQHKCVAVLLKMGANAFEFKTDDGGNMLHFAVKYASHFKDSQEFVNDTSLSLREVLKALNVLIDDVDNHGFTPLMYACKSGNPHCVKTLLENGASVNFSDSHGTSSLHLAAMSGNTECVQLLLNLKPKPEEVFFVGDLLRKARNKLEKKRAVKVSKENCLSPGNAARSYKKAIKRKATEERKDVKTRRIQLRNERSSTQYQQAVRESTTYEKDVGLWHCSDVEVIPPPIQAPQVECLSLVDSAINIVFDVETTSLATDADIIQLSAVHGNDEFNIHIIPGQKINMAASLVTQLDMVGGRLLHMGKPVPAEEPKEAFEKFLAWLKAKKEKVVLLAHNAERFDSKRIIYALKKYDLLSSFQECVLGFIDTLALFKKVLPGRVSYSQESLVADLLGVFYVSHDSLEDVKALQRLVSCRGFDKNQLIESSFSTESAVQSTEYCVKKMVNLRTLQPLIASEVVSKGMAEKIAGSGLTLHHLQLSFERGGEDGLISILSDHVNGKARVTKNRRILSQLSDYFGCNSQTNRDPFLGSPETFQAHFG